MSRLKIGIAPIGWTNDDMPDLGAEIEFEQCIDEMSIARYQGTEIGNKFPKDPKVLKDSLADKGLVVANSWHSTYILTCHKDDVEEDFRRKCQFLREVGAKIVGVSEQSYSIQGKGIGVFDNKYYMSLTEWDKLAQGLNALGEIALEYDISLAFHHHMGTVVQDEEEIDTLMRLTDRGLVNLLYDTGHLAYQGIDYIEILHRYIDRVKHIHLKDIRQSVIEQVRREGLSFLEGVRMGTFTVPGDGDLDFDKVMSIIASSQYNGWLLVEAEQDPKKAEPLEYALKAREYIDKLLERYSL